MLTRKQAAQLAEELCGQYDLPSAAARYRFANRSCEESWAERKVLELRAREATGSKARLEHYLRCVEFWGFGRCEPPRAALDQHGVVKAMLACWGDRTRLAYMPIDYVDTLAEVLALRGVGIARASKWVFFANPRKLAIYDSRTSWALRKLRIEGQRVFPQVARQEAGHRQALGQDAALSNPLRAVTAYWNYIAVLAGAAKILRAQDDDSSWTPGKVEAALFMLGARRTPDRDTATPLHRELNAPIVEEDAGRPCGF